MQSGNCHQFRLLELDGCTRFALLYYGFKGPNTTGMTSIGEMLRRERLKRNLELGQIAQELKIASRFLEAIEAGQLDKLPGGVFTKSFIIQYARLMGLDEKTIANELQRTLDPPPEVPASLEASKPVDSAIRVPRVEEWEAVGEGRFRWSSSSLTAAALVVVVMLLCSGLYALYAWWQRAHRSVASYQRPPVAAVQQAPPPVPVEQPPSPGVQPSTVPTGTQPPPGSTAPAPSTEHPAPPVTSPPATVPVAAASPSHPNAPPPATVPVAGASPSHPNAAVRVELTADEPVWVLARSDGKYFFSGTLSAKESRIIEATGTVLLRLGNAGGVTITLNGKPVGPVGPKGQVRTVQFTSGGFEIVAVPKSPAPLDPL
jgi:cytoskeleton protein RodZ